MKKQLLIGGVIGGVLVWLFMRNKCKPCPKCDSGGGGQRGYVSPAVVVQTTPAPVPPQTPVVPTPPSDKTLPVIDKPVMGQTSLAFTGKWGQWVK